jgi:hypothetical protein
MTTHLRPAALAILLATTSPAWAHGDEPHDAPAAAAPTLDAAPRATAQTESFELVAVLTDTGAAPTLTLYLDRFDSNAPVAGATVEIESGAFKAVARPAEPGVYTLPGQAFAQPGRYPLTISVQASEADGGADLLETTLSYTQALHAGHGAEDHAAAANAWPVSLKRILAGLTGAVALGLVARVVLKRRARHAHHASTRDLRS